MRLTLSVAALSGTLLIAGCGGGGDSESESSGAGNTLNGTLVIKADSFDNYFKTNAPCTGSGGYDDIREAAPVVVYDNGGKIIASASLGAGAPTQSPQDKVISDAMDRAAASGRRNAGGSGEGIPGLFDRGSTCTFPFADEEQSGVSESLSEHDE